MLWPVHPADVRGGQAARTSDDSGRQDSGICTHSVRQWPGAATSLRQQGCGYELSAHARVGCRTDLYRWAALLCCMAAWVYITTHMLLAHFDLRQRH